MTLRIGLFMFDDVEVLDFAGPFEVFSTASRVAARRAPQAAPPFEVVLISRDGGPVTARAGLVVQVQHALDTHPTLDVLLVPGGVVDAVRRQPEVVDWIAHTSRQARLTASVCTGAFLLADAGVVGQHTVTTHWEDLQDLRAVLPPAQVVEGPRYIDHGALVTSAGISAGLDMSLHLVGRLASLELAHATARQMDYAWSGPAA